MTAFWPSCNCCLNCEIATDDFATLGAWSVKSGIWNAVSGVARTSSTNAVMLYGSAHPDGHTSHVVTVKMRGASGDKARVLIASNSTGSSYLYAEITFGDPCGSLSINGGTAIPLDEALPNTWITLTVCYTDAVFSYGSVGSELIATVPSAFSLEDKRGGTVIVEHEGAYVGLGTGSVASQVDFDDFTWHKGSLTAGCDGCTHCDGSLDFDWTTQTGGGSPAASCLATMTGTVDSGLDGPATFTPTASVVFTAEEIENGISAIMMWSLRPTDVTIGPARFEFVSGSPDVVKCYINGTLQGNLTTAGNGYGVGLIDGQCCAFVVGALGVPTNIGFTAAYTGTYSNIGFTTDGGTVDRFFTSCVFVCSENVDCNQCSSAGDTPHFFKVVIAGMVSGTCDAASINGTYIIQQADDIGQPCWWRKLAIPLSGCEIGSFYITLKIVSVFPYTLSIHTDLGSIGEVIFDLVLPSEPIPCHSLEDAELDRNNARSDTDGPWFDTSGATFTVTAL